MNPKPNREEAFELLKKYNKSEALIKHALHVEATMRHFASLNNEDVEKWGVIGLLHDLDYEQYPDEHCKKVVEIAKEEGLDESYVRSIVSHGYGLCSDVEPIELMEKILYTTDELTGLINAYALMRPTKSVEGMEVKSLKKKYKQSSFAAGVDRSVIEKGLAMLNMNLDYIMEETIKAMTTIEAK